MTEPSDPELMVAIAAGDEHALRQLIRRHQNLVYGTIVKMLGDPVEAEDLAQEVFLRVYRAAPRYQPTAQFKTWLFTILRNLVFNEHRRRGRARLESLEGDSNDEDGRKRELPDTGQADAAQLLLKQEMMEAVDRAILALPEQQRLAVIMRRYDEFSYEEIAVILKVSVPSLKSLLFRARETLRDKLKQYLEKDRN
jgi:RNA polymerase sigma-70 factor (ECF subfamily)